MAGPVFPWETYGTVWHLRRPPVGEPQPDSLTIELLVGLITDHLPAAEVDEFRRELTADEDLSIEVLTAMLDAVHDIVSPDIPRASMRTLLDKFREVRPLIHGQLIRAGAPKGANGLDSYDAACCALAYMDEEYGQLHGWTVNEKARPSLLKQLDIGPKVESPLDQLAALQAQMGMAEGQTFARPARKPSPAPAD